MRIDYSEPKKAYVSHQGPLRQRKEPAGMFATIIVTTAVFTFIAGFGSGWFFSQKSAKKSFQAANEQNSLENSPITDPAPPPKPMQPAQPAANIQPQPDSSAAQQTSTGSGAAVDPPLSFYKSLPSGQKGNVMGSGINTNDRTKQPLQAAIPSNMTRPPTTDASKTPDDKPAASDKPAAKSTGNLTVQVASFPLKSEAETLKSKLAGKGYNAFIVESHQGDKGIWYRVRVGKKLDQESAKELAGKLGRTALVIPE